MEAAAFRPDFRRVSVPGVVEGRETLRPVLHGPANRGDAAHQAMRPVRAVRPSHRHVIVHFADPVRRQKRVIRMFVPG